MIYREIFPSLRQSCLHRSRATPGIGAPPCRPRALSPVCHFPTDAACSTKGVTQHLHPPLCPVPIPFPPPCAEVAPARGCSAAFSENSCPGTIASERFPTYHRIHTRGKDPCRVGFATPTPPAALPSPARPGELRPFCASSRHAGGLFFRAGSGRKNGQRRPCRRALCRGCKTPARSFLLTPDLVASLTKKGETFPTSTFIWRTWPCCSGARPPADSFPFPTSSANS